jgi:hypothetical protein
MFATFLIQPNLVRLGWTGCDRTPDSFQNRSEKICKNHENQRLAWVRAASAIAFDFPIGIGVNQDKSAEAARCAWAADENECVPFSRSDLPTFVPPLWRGPFAYLAHCGNEYGTSLKNQKTYGSVLVRFFCGKMHFAPLFWLSEKIRFATCTI